MSSITEEVIKQIYGFYTTQNSWLQLEKSYSWRSRARPIQVNEELQSPKKGTLTIAGYMLRIKLISYELEAADRVLIEGKNVMTILGGLDEQHDIVFSVLTEMMMYEPVKVDAKALLLSHENRSERRKVTYISPLPTINLSVLGPRSSDNNPQTLSSADHNHMINNTLGSQKLSQTMSSYEFPSSCYFPNDVWGIKGRGYDRNRERSQCQLYGKLGHVVATYWYWFDKNFVSPTQQGTSNRSSLIPPQHMN